MNLVEVKNEYTTQLVNILSPHIYDGIYSIYEESVNIATNKLKDTKKILKTFQKLLFQIQRWNQDLINRETERIQSESKCEWVDDLIKAVIKANIILLTNTTPNYSFNTIDTRIYQNVQMNNFIHKCYLECAMNFINSAYLFNHFKGAEEIQKNQKKILNIIQECIKEAIRKMLPFKYMLHKYLEAEYTMPNNENIVNSLSEEDFTNVHNLDKEHKTITYDNTKQTIAETIVETNNQPIINEVDRNTTLKQDLTINDDPVTKVELDNDQHDEQTLKLSDMKETQIKYNITLDTKQETDIDKLNEMFKQKQEEDKKIENERYQQYLLEHHSEQNEEEQHNKEPDEITLNINTKEDTKQQLTLDINTKDKSTFKDTLLNPLEYIIKDKQDSNNNINEQSKHVQESNNNIHEQSKHIKGSNNNIHEQIKHNKEALKGSIYDVSDEEDEEEEDESITYHQNDEDFEDVFSNNPMQVEKQQTVQSVSDVFIPPKKVDKNEHKQSQQKINDNPKQQKNADQQKKNAFFAKYFEL